MTLFEFRLSLALNVLLKWATFEVDALLREDNLFKHGEALIAVLA